MRIWSKRLIKTLPNKQLKSMRYELGDMIKQYPNIKHGLVKFANNYDINYLYDYFVLVCLEVNYRKINYDKNYNNKITHIANQKGLFYENDKNYTFNEDDEEYLKICCWNLYEKYLRNMITNDEWEKIEDYIGELL